MRRLIIILPVHGSPDSKTLLGEGMEVAAGRLERILVRGRSFAIPPSQTVYRVKETRFINEIIPR